ncbi:MAG: sugar ABC transporter permease [Spirochaetes bacterium]|jgi:multiple sugar transport system permease protein|nr:sugar ABC transporter permease [Spirochaetota bacterium]
MHISDWVERNIRYIFILPAAIFVVVMVAFPLGYTLVISLRDWNLTTYAAQRWIGVQNYLTLFSDARFWAAMGRTLAFSFGAVAVEMLLGVAIALFLNREIRGKNLTKTLFLLPMVATPVAVGMVWLLIYEPSLGLANHVLKLIGMVPQPWLTSRKTVLGSLMLVDIWQWTPIIMLITLAGLAILPRDPYDSARIDGANKAQILARITLPLVMPTVLVGILIRLIDALKTYDIIYSTTQGGPGEASETLNILGYVLGFSYFKMGLGAALIVLFLVTVTLVSLLVLALKSSIDRRTGW